MIPVTQPFLPPLKEYNHYLKGIWKRNWLTNMGPLVTEFETTLKHHLGLKQLLFVTNGTTAIQMAIKALDLKGEIITTPFSFVATTSAIVWENCQPVFVDIEKNTLNINPDKIEAAITKNTSAILATHVYGNPCDVEKIDRIAKKHNLKVIYDGAHAFGVCIKKQSIFNYGDISICSLHATKLFHSGEGGFIVTKNKALLTKLDYMRNFGFDGPEHFSVLGINGKNSEIHAALGLTNIKHIDDIINNRKKLANRYDIKLKNINATQPIWHNHSHNNYAYYPIIFDQEKQMIDTMKSLLNYDIHTRRYFYPSLTISLPYVEKIKLSVVEDIANRVLCLPLYHNLKIKDVDFISQLIMEVQKKY